MLKKLLKSKLFLVVFLGVTTGLVILTLGGDIREMRSLLEDLNKDELPVQIVFEIGPLSRLLPR